MILDRIFRCRDGGVLPLFALSVIPLFGFIGAAVDYSRANAVKSALQAALDSTALMLSKDAASLNQSQMQQKAHDYFIALFNRPDAQNVTVNAPIYNTASGSQLTITASAQVKTEFMRMVGYSQLSVSSTAIVKWGNSKLRVALALDNTGSMAQSGKMTALKAATHNLLNSLQNAATQNGDVYVSIVPFNRDVNVGTANVNANWINWTYWDQQNRTWNGSAWVPNNHNTWNGCVMDRDQNNDTKNTTPVAGTTATMFPAEQYGSCPTSLLPLTYNWTALHSKVDAMISAGNTNQTIGLVWAWQSLTETSPLSPPPINPNDPIPTQKIIILLTDGLNTQNRWTTSQSSINARTQLTCDNIKAQGITLYTVLVMEGNATLLQNCATGPTKFFNLTSADEIVTTFDQIGTQLTKLRIAQ
ncbi:MAG: VWA domain-containing protein [Proteobacteria bacterium]|nr:VWA domain-containing protein [Pseudomonadota bacterium]